MGNFEPNLLEDLRVALATALQRADELKHQMGRGENGREVALVVTKLEEAELWLSKVK